MPTSCGVRSCRSTAKRDSVKFYHIPQIDGRNEKLKKLSRKRQKLWIRALKRQDLTGTMLKNTRVCSLHFVSGKSSTLCDTQSPDWIPTQNMQRQKAGAIISARDARAVKRNYIGNRSEIIYENLGEVPKIENCFVTETTNESSDPHTKETEADIPYVDVQELINPSLQIIVEDEVHDEDDDIEEVEEMGETEEIEESEDIEEIEEIETATSHNTLKRNSITIDHSETVGTKLYRQSDMEIITETEELDKDSENESTAIAHIIPINRNSAMYVNEKQSGKSRGKIAYQFDDPNQLCQVEMAPTPPAGGVTVARIDGTYINKLQPIQQLPKLFKQENNIIKPGTQITIGGTTKRFVPLVTTNGAIPKLVGTPRFFIKRPLTKTIREVTMELIDKSTEFHLGVVPDRLTILKTIVCTTAKIPLIDLYITLKKLRLNEDFRLLSEYFEMPETDIKATFSRTVVKLSKYLKFLIRWPEGKKYYDRHKNMPISFRSKLSYVQSLIECVETEIRKPLYPTLDMIDCKNFKFILTITPSGIISYISEAYVGDTDDLTIFNECNFRNIIPKYLSLVADPGELRTTVGGGGCIRRGRTTINNSKRKDVFDSDSTTDSAEEIEELISTSPEPDYKKSSKPQYTSTSTVNIVNSHLKSLKGKDISIPTLRVREPACRLQIRNIIYSLREFKILQPYAVLEPNLYQYINEILVIVSALTNLQRNRNNCVIGNNAEKFESLEWIDYEHHYHKL